MSDSSVSLAEVNNNSVCSNNNIAQKPSLVQQNQLDQNLKLNNVVENAKSIESGNVVKDAAPVSFETELESQQQLGIALQKLLENMV